MPTAIRSVADWPKAETSGARGQITTYNKAAGLGDLFKKTSDRQLDVRTGRDAVLALAGTQRGGQRATIAQDKRGVTRVGCDASLPGAEFARLQSDLAARKITVCSVTGVHVKQSLSATDWGTLTTNGRHADGANAANLPECALKMKYLERAMGGLCVDVSWINEVALTGTGHTHFLTKDNDGAYYKKQYVSISDVLFKEGQAERLGKTLMRL
ncbi:hypothetical protein T492DRAFT_839699 [Pavlovales sp. CCMP2436]|nr:hypothetical protein T492DRAFT_839699 [Pavlovales sp. CCMP2436]